jgi:hypothetical protein
MAARSIGKLPRQRPRLALEIAIVLGVKILLLYFIWLAWFSEPTTKKMQLPPAEVAQRMLATQSSGENVSPQATDPAHSDKHKE